MEISEIYRNYECLDKPHQDGATVTRAELHKEILKHIDSIGNSNPHWNRLNEMESELRNWYW